jgi:hypothetical protein
MTNLWELIVWANLETQVDEPPSPLQNSGYAPLEQPYNEHHNWIWNRDNKKTNEIIRERNMAQKFSRAISKEQQVAGRFGDQYASWVHPYPNHYGDSVNVRTYFGNQPICVAPAWDYTNDVACVYVGRDGWNTGIESHRQASTGIEIDTINLTFNEGTEYVEAIVSEGEYFYVMTLGHSSGDAYFYRFSANPLSPTPAWSTSDAGSNFKTKGRNAMCIAGDFLAYLRTDLNATDDVVRLIRKVDAGEFRQGTGNMGTLPGTYWTGHSIVSNGTSVFFAAYDGISTGNVYLVGADIADPDLATYPSGSCPPCI